MGQIWIFYNVQIITWVNIYFNGGHFEFQDGAHTELSGHNLSKRCIRMFDIINVLCIVNLNLLHLLHHEIWVYTCFHMVAILNFKMAAREKPILIDFSYSKHDTRFRIGWNDMFMMSNMLVHLFLTVWIILIGGHFEIQNGRWRRGRKKWNQSFLDSAPSN